MKKMCAFFAVLAFILAVAGTSAAQEQQQIPPVPQPVKKEAKEVTDAKETKETKDAKDAKPAQGGEPPAPPAEVALPQRDIADIPVPAFMKLDKAGTFLVEAKGMKVGVLAYAGRVDGYSLSETIKNTLTEEQWKFQNMLTYKNTVSINFSKGDRTCSVFIDEGWFKTRLEIRVGIVAH